MDATIYPSIRRFLHWLIAFMFVGMIASGLYMTTLSWGDPETRELADELYHAHKWGGFALLGLMALRVLVSVIAPRPPLPAHVSAAERSASRLVHVTLYALLIATPLLGWAAVSTGGFLPAPLFGEVEMPALLEKTDETVANFLFDMHWVAAMALAALVGVHVLAAFSHLIRADGVFKRMWFPPTPGRDG